MPHGGGSQKGHKVSNIIWMAPNGRKIHSRQYGVYSILAWCFNNPRTFHLGQCPVLDLTNGNVDIIGCHNGALHFSVCERNLSSLPDYEQSKYNNNKSSTGTVSWQQQTTQNCFTFHWLICSKMLNVQLSDYKSEQCESDSKQVYTNWRLHEKVEKICESAL